jgi:hypothetical protein
MTLTSVRLLGRHLTPENHQTVLARARGQSRPRIEALVAELAPQPDVPPSVRKLPTFTALPHVPASSASGIPLEPTPVTAPSPAEFVPTSRPIVRARAPERYRVQFTIGQDTHARLRVVIEQGGASGAPP